MNEIPLKQVIDASVENLKKAMSVDTVIGTPITLPDSTVVIPVSRVSVGFTSGGIDFDSKNNPKRDDPHFGGGNGAGMAVNPVGFLICSASDVRFLPISGVVQSGSDNIVGSVTELLEKSPSIIEKIKAVFSKKKDGEDKSGCSDGEK